uniref:Uncharacterized protein n=1 Tax=Anguilla anguilla TaxID=7936 RepID=A0A0E9XMX0_ANGAN
MRPHTPDLPHAAVCLWLRQNQSPG